MTTATERLGPAERIIQTILAYSDHVYHGRPGIVVPSNVNVGVTWSPVTHKVEDGVKVVYKLDKVGKKTVKTRLGTLESFQRVMNGDVVVGHYRPAGLFPEVATWFYRQIAEVWKLDNEFAAHWASFAYNQEHKDLKAVLAAFLMCQSRKGDPVKENDAIVFHDSDFRDVGEAMLLTERDDKKHLDAKYLLRIHRILNLPGIAAINRELGFGKSTRHPFLGRWEKAVEKWLRHREENPKMLEGLVKKGFRTTIMKLARLVGYKPESKRFFETLRWKQGQAKDGRRTIFTEIKAAESWEDLTEKQICERIVSTKPDFKRIVGLVPKNVGITRAIVAAAIESGGFSNKDLVNRTPTLEELGLLQVPDVRARWELAVKASEDMRAANIAKNVKTKEVADVLQDGADNALKKAVAEDMKAIRVYLMVDCSGSMEGAIEAAKETLTRFVQGFPLDKLHVSTFNTVGREIKIAHQSKAGVENAFKGVAATGGTDYGAGVRVLQHHKYVGVGAEDSVFIFIGDEEAHPFKQAVVQSGLNPTAFGFIKVKNSPGYRAVQQTAEELGIPCFMIDPKMFDGAYEVTRTIRALIASTPVGRTTAQVAPRLSLVEQIMQTPLLQKPMWSQAN